MMGTGQAIALAAKESDGGQWVQLFTAAKAVQARDGRAWRMPDLAAVVAATKRRAGQTPLAIDYEHQVERSASNGQPAPAAGWIVDLEARADGIWGLVEWTAKAAGYLSNREYRFISPSFLHSKSGEVREIVGAGLTNRPALELTALAKDRPEMDPTTEAALAALRSLYGLAETAAPDAIVEAARTSLAAATAAADPARFVPIETFEDVVAQLNVASRGVSDEAAAIAVDREIATGRLVPSMRDWGISLCRQNKPAFDGFIERTAGGLKYLFVDQNGRRPALPRDQFASDEDAEIARNLGLTAAEMKAAQ